MITIEDFLKEQLFCSLYRGLLYMTKNHNVSEPDKIWAEALNSLRELENKNRKDILILNKYGKYSSYENMTILAVMFYMIIAKEDEGYLTRSDLKDEMVSMLKGYGDKWNELYSQFYKSEDYEEKKNRFVGEFDYLENKDDANQLTETDLTLLEEIKKLLLRCEWKQPANDKKITIWIDTMFGADTTLLEFGDKVMCEKFRNFFAKGRSGEGERKYVSLANVIGYLAKQSLLTDNRHKLSKDVFQNEDQSSNIDKGLNGGANQNFKEIVPFMEKYILKIIKT